MSRHTAATMPHPTDDFLVSPRALFHGAEARDPHPVLLRTYDSRTQPGVTFGDVDAQRALLAAAGVESYAVLRDVGRYMVIEVYAARQQLTDARARRHMAPPPDAGDEWRADADEAHVAAEVQAA